MRDLMFKGLKRFGEFAEAGENIATNVLADRLERLECAGVVTRAPDSLRAFFHRYLLPSPLTEPYYYVQRNTRHVLFEQAMPLPTLAPPLLVLASLADGPKHGYAMIEDIERMSGAVLGPGTLYGAIARLEQGGLIRPLQQKERRQPYQITADGLRELRARLETMNRFAEMSMRKLEAR